MSDDGNTIKVWDPFVRTFHWTLAASFVLAWVTSEEREVLHQQLGLFMLVLIGLRIFWGFAGTRAARFSDFVRPGSELAAYLRGFTQGRPAHYRGHNPLGGWMVIGLLVMLTATGASGLAMDGGRHALWEELHEGLAVLSLLMVAAHVGGVLIASRLHRENLIVAMISGNKPRGGRDV